MGPSADKEHVWFLDTQSRVAKALTRAGRTRRGHVPEELLSHAAFETRIHGIVLRNRIRLDEKASAHFPTCGGSRAAGRARKH